MSDSSPLIRVLIADDEPVARATLRKLLRDEAGVEVVAECASGPDVLRAVARERPDLLFLDVQMPGANGLEALESLRSGGETRPAVVFTTAYDQYAVQAFEAQAVDYLLKPFDDARFRIALGRAREQLRLASLSSPAPTEYADRIRIHKEGRLELVEVGDVEWIEAADQYVRIHTGSGQSHLMRGSMSELERSLDPTRFARVHRSAILALDRVARLESASSGNGRALLKDGTEVPVSRSRIPGVRRLLG